MNGLWLRYAAICAATAVLSFTPASKCTADISASFYPQKVVTISVPFNAGSNTDGQVRFLQRFLEKHLGSPTIIVNTGGASGIIGVTNFIKDTAQDGYTVLFSLPTPTLYKPITGDTMYKVGDLRPVAQVSSSPMYLVVRADSPFTTGKDLIEYIRNNPNKYTFASAGNGGNAHLAFATFLFGEGLKALSLPFSGGTADCYNAVMGGHIDAYCVSEQEIAGRSDVRALINLGSKSKHAQFINVPTLSELGYQGYGIDTFAAFYFGREVDDAIAKKFESAVKAALSDPDFIKEAENAQFDISYVPGKALEERIEKTVERVTPVMQNMGLINN